MRRIESNTGMTNKTKWFLAALFLTAAQVLAETNNATGTQPAQRVKRNVVVSIPDRKLAVIEEGRVLKIYAVAVGAAVSPSPEGQFEIVNRITAPTYYHPGQVVEAGPSNPLGTRWIGLSKKGYGIHGTNAPRSIGKAASHGCIRVGKRDLEELFEIVSVGDTVQICGERDDQLTRIFGSEADKITLAQANAGGNAGGQ